MDLPQPEIVNMSDLPILPNRRNMHIMMPLWAPRPVFAMLALSRCGQHRLSANSLLSPPT